MNSFLKTIKKEEKNFYEKGVEVSYKKLKNLVQYLNEKFDINKEINNKFDSMKKDVGDIKNQLDSVTNDLKDSKKFAKGLMQIKTIETSAAKSGLNNSIFDFFKKNNFTADENSFRLGSGVVKAGYELEIDVPEYEDKEVKFTFKSNNKASSGIKEVALIDKSSESTSDEKSGGLLDKATSKLNESKVSISGSDYNDKIITNKLGLYNKINAQCLGVTKSNLDTIITTMKNTFYSDDVGSINSKLKDLKKTYEEYKNDTLVVNKNAHKPEIVVEEIYNIGGGDNEKGAKWQEYVKQADNVRYKGGESEKKLLAKQEKSQEKKDNETQNIKNYIKSFLEELDSMSENGIDFDYKNDVEEIDNKITSNDEELEVKPKEGEEKFDYESGSGSEESGGSGIKKIKIKSNYLKDAGLDLEQNDVNRLLKGKIDKKKKTIVFSKIASNNGIEIPAGKDLSTLRGEIEFPELFYYISKTFKEFIEQNSISEEEKAEEERKRQEEEEKQKQEAVKEQSEPSSEPVESEPSGGFDEDGLYSSGSERTSIDDIVFD